MAYRAPARLTSGTPTDMERALLAELRRVESALASGGAGIRDPRGAAPARPQPGEFVRVADGQPVILPHPRPARGQSVYVLAEGSCVVTTMSGTVNGATSVDVSAAGLVVAVSSGDGWSVGGDADQATQFSVLGRAGSGTGPVAPITIGVNQLLGRHAGGDVGGQSVQTEHIAASAVAAANVLKSDTFAWTGAHTFGHTVRFTGEFSTTLSAQADNLAIGNVSVVLISLTGAQNLSGMTGGAAGRVVFILNSDNADTLTLLHDSTSTAINRFVGPNGANYTVPPLGGVVGVYNSSRTRWHVIGK